MTAADNVVLKNLFSQIANNSSQAFEAFYHHTRRWVFYQLQKLSGCREKAEDLTQTFYILMWDKRSKLSTVETPSAFIATCLRRHAINLYRREKLIKEQRVQLRIMAGLEGRNDTQEKVDAKQLEALIERAAARLSPMLSAIFRLRQYHMFSYEQIAEQLSLKPDSCYTYHYLALKQLRTILKPYYN